MIRSRLAIVSIALLAVAALAVPAAEAKTTILDAGCSVTGDVCVSALRAHGRIKLMARSFVDFGQVTLCVTEPGSKPDCRQFELRTAKHGIYQSRVDWRRQFGYSKGRHRATWRADGASRPFGGVHFTA